MAQRVPIGNMLFNACIPNGGTDAAATFICDFVASHPDLPMLVIDGTLDITVRLQRSQNKHRPGRIKLVRLGGGDSAFSINLTRLRQGESSQERVNALMSMLLESRTRDVHDLVRDALTIAVHAQIPISRCGFELFTVSKKAFGEFVRALNDRGLLRDEHLRSAVDRVRAFNSAVRASQNEARTDDDSLYRERDRVFGALATFGHALACHVDEDRFDLDAHFDHGGVLVFDPSMVPNWESEATSYFLTALARDYLARRARTRHVDRTACTFVTVINDFCGTTLPSLLHGSHHAHGNRHIIMSALVGSHEEKGERDRFIQRLYAATDLAFTFCLAHSMTSEVVSPVVSLRNTCVDSRQQPFSPDKYHLLGLPYGVALVSQQHRNVHSFHLDFRS